MCMCAYVYVRMCVCLCMCFSIIHQFLLYTPDHFKQHKVNCHALKGDSKCFVFDLKKKNLFTDARQSKAVFT